jgi:hypothetical protein
MIICFDCPRETKERLDALLDSGQYKDYAELISVAVANLAILQRHVGESGILVISSDEQLESGSRSTSTIEEHPRTTVRKRDVILGSHEQKTKRDRAKPIVEIPSLFLRSNAGEPPSLLANVPSDVWTLKQVIPLDRWLFGQYNKILPAKANCRALSNMLKQEHKGVPISKAASQIAEEATVLGDFLVHLDEVNSIGRDDALSIAFPSTDANIEKAQLRYANQFVASINQQGQVSGLLIDLKLINHTGGKEPRILLTKPGWDFAMMPNPILDGTQEMPTQKFSAAERDFLLDHISRCVPAENFAYRAILSAIMEGANTPDMIDAALQKYVPHNTNRSLSQSFLASQRSGAISRMSDLGLVLRVRDGVRVSYVVTDTGRQFGLTTQ